MAWHWPEVWHGERGGWWRVVLVLAIRGLRVAGGIAAFVAIHVTLLRSMIKAMPEYEADIVRQLVASPLQHGLAIGAVLLGAWWVHRRSPRCLFSDGREIGVRLTVWSAVVWGILWTVGTLAVPGERAVVLRRLQEVPLVWWIPLSVVTLGAAALGAAGEELLFRGYLLTRLAALVKRPWVAVVVSSVFFAALHLQSSWAAKGAVVLFGMALCVGCIRAGTLGPLISMHAMNNALQRVFFQRLDNSGTTWGDFVIVAVSLGCWVGWLFWATGAGRRGS
ncbi:MAG: CPBP family glutamic-type intramembrane protease [Phycisphaerae bacterium]